VNGSIHDFSTNILIIHVIDLHYTNIRLYLNDNYNTIFLEQIDLMSTGILTGTKCTRQKSFTPQVHIINNIPIYSKCNYDWLDYEVKDRSTDCTAVLICVVCRYATVF
jgi:hypothetical protein